MMSGFAAVLITLAVIVVLPPLQRFASLASAWFGEALADHYFAWSERTAASERETQHRRSYREFLGWLSSHLGYSQGGDIDEEMARAHKLTPMIRLLLEEEKRVHPHRFRHSTAVSLVAAGVDITVIRSWLGHESLDTTNDYARANLETKRRLWKK